jgi:hypothetical protein
MMSVEKSVVIVLCRILSIEFMAWGQETSHVDKAIVDYKSQTAKIEAFRYTSTMIKGGVKPRHTDAYMIRLLLHACFARVRCPLNKEGSVLS